MSARKPRASRARRCTRIRIGRVSVYLHHGAWWVYYRDGEQPLRRRIGPDRAAAERIAAEVNAQVVAASPTLFAFTPVCIEDLQRSFLEHHEQVLRSSVATIQRYRTATQHLVEFFATRRPGTRAHEVSATAFVTFLRSRAVSPNGHANTPKRCLRDKGVQFVVEVCRSMYAFAQRQRHLPPYSSNPFSDLRVDRMRIEDAKPVFVFDAQTELKFLHAAHHWEFPVHFALAKTGLRPGELCHLLIEEVDLANGWLHVRNKPELGWSVKTRNERSVPLIAELCEVLSLVIGSRTAGVVFQRPRFDALHRNGLQQDRRGLLAEFEVRLADEAERHGRPPTRTERAKVARRLWQDAGALDPDQIRTSFIRIASRCALTGATCPKSWRHTFATLLQDANVDPLLRQITMGHKPNGASGALGMTAVYTHSRPETHAREILRALAAWPQSLDLARTWAQGGAS